MDLLLFVICYVLALSAVVFISRFAFGQIDRLLRRACGVSHLRIPFQYSRPAGAHRHRLRNWYSAFRHPISFTKRGLLRFMINRKVIQQIHSENLGDEVRQAYHLSFNDRLTQTRLRLYIRSKKRGEPDVVFELLKRRLQLASFALASPVHVFMVGFAVFFAKGDRRGPPRRLFLVMEFWALLLYNWAVQPSKGKMFERCLRFCFRQLFRRLMLQGVGHECIHVIQEIQSDFISRDFETGLRGKKKLTLREYLKVEMEAHVFGSPLWVLLISALFIPIVYKAMVVLS